MKYYKSQQKMNNHNLVSNLAGSAADDIGKDLGEND